MDQTTESTTHARTPAFIATLSACYSVGRMTVDEIILELEREHPTECLLVRPSRAEVHGLVKKLRLTRPDGSLSPDEIAESRQRVAIDRVVAPIVEAQQRWLAEQALEHRQLVTAARRRAIEVLGDPEAGTKAQQTAVSTLDLSVRMVRRDWGIDRREQLEDHGIKSARERKAEAAADVSLDFHNALTVDS